MNDFSRFQKVAGLSAVLLPVATVINAVLFFASVKSDRTGFNDPYGILSIDPSAILSAGSSGANLFHWSMVFDLFAYLSFAPIALLCWNWFKAKSPNLVLLYTICGMTYSLLGAIGAVLLGAIVPFLVNDYALATEAQKEIMQILVGTLYQAVAFGLWNPLEILLIGIWFLGIGPLLRRERPALGILTLIIGAFAMLDALGWITKIEIIFITGVFGMSLLMIWAAWFGIDLLRQSVQID
jgi:hypothetical protein